MKKTILTTLILFFLCLTSHVFATTYYVSTTGDDRNSGTSPSTPWKHCPGMTGWSGSTTLSNGDTVLFRSQDTWSGTPNGFLQTTTAGVTYDGGTYGTGTRATIQASADAVPGSWPLVLLNHSNTVFKNFDLDGNNKNCSGVQAMSESGNTTNIEINNVIVHDTGSSDDYQYGILVGSASGNRTDDVRVINCVVHDVGHEGICLYPSSAPGNQISNITVRNCKVYNTGLTNQDYGDGILIKNYVSGATIEFNNLYNNGAVGIQFETAPGIVGPTGVRLGYNLIRKNKGWGLYVVNEGSRALQFEFYGNLLIDNGSAGVYGGGAWITYGDYQTSTIKLYNNTFYCFGNTPYNGCIQIMSGVTGTPTIELKNNILYADDHPVIYDDTGNKLARSHNLFYRTSSASDTVIYDGGSAYNRSMLVCRIFPRRLTTKLGSTPMA
jgi:hypothetical protein